LKTTQYFPKALERSLVLSVFPVPAGPDGAPPNFRCKAPVMVSQHLSVKGVITILVVAPRYSYPYLKLALTYLTYMPASS